MSVIANDASALLLDQVNQALAAKTPLRIQGGATKAFLGRAVEGQLLDVREHRGIVSYDPTELVVSVRAGTPLAELEATLDEAGQMLPCEPPHFGEGATVGGMIAAGLSGPRRPWSGSVRDFVLGSRIITGQGKHLRFGGEVMKNVAGYDLSRLMAGSFGCLGVLTEVSLKVLPKPRQCTSLRLEIDLERALLKLAEWGQQPVPISAASHDGQVCTCAWKAAKGRSTPRANASVARTSSPATGMTCASSAWPSLPTRARCGACRCRTTRRPWPCRASNWWTGPAPSAG